MLALARQNEVASDWLNMLVKTGRSPATVRNHERLLDQLFHYLQVEGNIDPDEADFRAVVPIYSEGTFLGKGPVNQLFVERFLTWACRKVEDQEQAAKRRNDLLQTLHMFFKTVVSAGSLQDDPTTVITRAKVRVKVNHRKYLTPVESAALIEAAASSAAQAPRNFTLMVILLRAGLRPAEACGLRLCDVDLEQGLIRVTGKTGPRVVPLVPAATKVVESYIRSRYYRELHLPDGHLFVSDNGTKPINVTGLRRLVRLLCKEARIDRAVTTYWLRHTFATHAHRAGVEFPIISQALGHAKITNTYTYVHGRESRMRRIVERGPAAVPFVDVHRALLRATTAKKGQFKSG